MDATMKPMLCGTVDDVPTGPEWIIEGKFDGWRIISHRCADERVAVFSGRNSSEYSGKLPYIEAELLACLPPDTVVDGELIGGDSGWGDVQGVMTRGCGPHVPSAHVPALRFVVFDVLRIAGEDARALPWHMRRQLLEKIEWQGHVVTQVYGPSTPEAHDALLAMGLEGSVCKHREGRYVNSRAPHLWVKCKPQTTDEARIVGFKAGKVGGAWDGAVGAFEVEMLGADGQPTGATTTLKCGVNKRHHEATAERDGKPFTHAPWLGTVIEVKHHGLGDTGVPRHPQFLRRRDDQTAPAPARRTAPARARKEVKKMRNYAAMGDAKLVKCVAELRAGAGDAVERVEQKGGSVQADLNVAESVAAERGLEVAA